jgi:hypothetical protein
MLKNMKVKIFSPAKSAMQSGKRNTKKWLVEPIEETNLRSINPLTGWVSADSTLSQFRFEFVSKEEAIKFAQSRDFKFEVIEPKTASLKQKSYAGNFTN